ncbi:MAG: cation/H(+) antiporter, partial [Flavobacteriaceae bacterium]|nr:cation/H(+) antiporter [Flavobacteriaceae bacterium]
MKNYKNTFFYFSVTGGFTALIYWIISKGKVLETAKRVSTVATPNNHWNDFISSMVLNFQDPLAILLAQIITIIIVARFFG